MTIEMTKSIIDFQADEASELAIKFNGFKKDSVRNIITMASFIVDVEGWSNKEAQIKFYDKIKLKQKSPTVSKLKAIGGKRGRFEPLLDKLPNNWTTLYNLAKLDDLDFTAICTSGKLQPFATAKEIFSGTELLNSNVAVSLRIAIDVSEVIDPELQEEFMERLNELAAEYRAKVLANKNPKLAGFYGGREK